MIVQFDATIDDLVDVSMRSLTNSKTVNSWRWQGAALTAVVFAVPTYFLLGETIVARLALAAAAAILGVAVHSLTYRDNLRKRTRKLCRELIGSDAPFTVTVELRDDGISFSQMGACTISGWSTIDRVEESEDALYFLRKDNSCAAVRKRAFDSIAIKDEFLRRAETYIQQSRGTICSNS